MNFAQKCFVTVAALSAFGAQNAYSRPTSVDELVGIFSLKPTPDVMADRLRTVDFSGRDLAITPDTLYSYISRVRAFVQEDSDQSKERVGRFCEALSTVAGNINGLYIQNGDFLVDIRNPISIPIKIGFGEGRILISEDLAGTLVDARPFFTGERTEIATLTTLSSGSMSISAGGLNGFALNALSHLNSRAKIPCFECADAFISFGGYSRLFEFSSGSFRPIDGIRDKKNSPCSLDDLNPGVRQMYLSLENRLYSSTNPKSGTNPRQIFVDED